MPPEYKAAGMSQEAWAKMNAPDGEAPQSAKAKTPAPAAPKTQIASQPASPAGPEPLEALVARVTPHIIQVESGGNARAKNPLSSAAGLGQFTTGTWAAVMRAHPELNLTPEGRLDPAQSKRALQAFGLDNAKYLQSRGLPVTPGTIYLAHFLGTGGAADLLHTPDGIPATATLSHAVLASNPFLRGMSVGQIKAWAEKKMGGKVGAPVAPDLGATATAGLFSGAGAGTGGIPLESGKGDKGGSGGSVSAKSEELSHPAAPQEMSHADRLAMLRQFMALAGFTPEELG
jgi:hypothetical protein